jgi:hypothetical protein
MVSGQCLPHFNIRIIEKQRFIAALQGKVAIQVRHDRPAASRLSEF